MSTLHRRPNMPVAAFLTLVRNGVAAGESIKAICKKVDEQWPHPQGKAFGANNLSMKLSQVRGQVQEALIKAQAQRKKVSVSSLQADKEFMSKLEEHLDKQIPSLRVGRSKSDLLAEIDLSIFDEETEETEEVEAAEETEEVEANQENVVE